MGRGKEYALQKQGRYAHAKQFHRARKRLTKGSRQIAIAQVLLDYDLLEWKGDESTNSHAPKLDIIVGG